MRWQHIILSPGMAKNSEIGYLYGESGKQEIHDTADIVQANIDNNVNAHAPNQLVRKIASFDLDQTLITTISRKRFPVNSRDWRWAYDNVIDKLYEYFTNGYEIIIVTNQAGIKGSMTKSTEFKTKIEYIEHCITAIYPTFAFKIFCANNKDVHRKPYPTFFKNLKIDHINSFFCGDGAGRAGDHTSADIKFAYNCMIKFITPEKLFLDDQLSRGIIEYPIKPLDGKLFDPKTKYIFKQNRYAMPELILMVGLPASGKTFIAQYIINKFIEMVAPVKYLSLDILSKSKMLAGIKTSAINEDNILIDNTNLDIETRANIIKLVKGVNNNYYVRIVYVNTTYERCLHNNYYRYYVNYQNDPKLIPEFVYKMMMKKFIKPLKSENKLINEVNVARAGIPLEFPYTHYYF